MIPYEGFVLGVGTGAVCLGTCGPVLIPFLMGEARTVWQNAGVTAAFLSGRLIAYLLVGLLSGIAGITLLNPLRLKPCFIGSLFVLLSISMLFYGFFRFKQVCLGHNPGMSHNWRPGKGIGLFPFLVGMLTGLNLCPPFLLAIAAATQTGKWTGGIAYFFFFFLGTLLFFIPLPFVGFFRKSQATRVIGKFASIVAGLYYLYKGSILILGCVAA